MGKSFVRSYRIPLYGSRLYVCLADDIKAGIRALPNSKVWDTEYNECSVALTMMRRNANTFAVIFLRNGGHPSHDDIAHEVFHAAVCIMRAVGVCFRNDDDDANEAHAYLIGEIAEMVYDACDACRRADGNSTRKETA